MKNPITTFKDVNNIGFDAKKTEELVAGLQKDGVSVGIEDLSSYLRTQGLIVQEHIGRKRNYVKVSPKLFGVDLTQKGTEVNEFFKQHMQMGKISFIPEEYEAKLVKIDNGVRMNRKRNAIGYDYKFMTLDSYNTFVEFVETKKKEYFETRDEILAKWDFLIERFKELLKNTLDDLQAIDKDKVFQTIMSRIPSKTEYADSFYMTVGAKAFPVTENLDMFSKDIQDQIKDGLNQDTVSTLYEIVGNTLNDAFENINKVLVAIQKNQKPGSKPLTAVKSSAKRIGQKNIFNNPKIEDIRKSMLAMLEFSPNYDFMSEEGEIITAVIYGYAKELEIEHTINLQSSPLSEEELLEMYDSLEGTTFETESGRKVSLNKMSA
ncbi:hypothetical protein PP175_26855 (plasmid) [Aneurinibacillus sp. Ricciae_BoGa-3]|uniref:hypothetical protein n=1 Tax=Aneurinibacillus sp. Ricciae_BoGa-3 TaxID=3022697 RepID=UPI0023408FC2|nr:hypothetical protein [Aneurinibacillus sp. Ricciae_BoGa-3]WCK57658.1 hypothetical protein PP175_26855 [Aneurinibacillus sp. Ricciae_BoGa-3]